MAAHRLRFQELGAGFGVGAYFLIKEGNDRIDEGEEEMDDEKKDKGKIFKYSGYGAAALSGLILIRGVYFLFRDKGPPSTAIITTRDISWRPVFEKDVAGVEATIDF